MRFGLWAMGHLAPKHLAKGQQRNSLPN